MSKLRSWNVILLLAVFCAATAMVARAQDRQTSASSVTFTSLFSFDVTHGAFPEYGPLAQGLDGNFYGTTYGGETASWGTVYKITAGGAVTTLYNFCSQPYCADGSNPWDGVVLATNGNFYAATGQGGANGWGTVFKITPTGALSTIYSFCSQPGCTDGVFPVTALVQGTNGNFFGTTPSAAVFGSYGTVFEITPAGTLTTLHTFEGDDGDSPGGPLIQATDGNFYGTTGAGGAYGLGTVFKISAGGKLTTLHSFNGTDGSGPDGPLVQASDGNFYGTTTQGGAHNNCPNGCGTVFKITPGGTLITLHSFDGTDGSFAIAGLIQATDGNFYGTTEGGASGSGTVFKITAGGTLTTLHTFDGTDGYAPAATLLQATNGNLYGTTTAGGEGNACGSFGCGTVFSLSVGLRPFVKTLPTAGKAGRTVIILGSNLKGATNVTFNGIPATITFNSKTEIKTTVPSGATTGYVKVTTPSGTLTSNVKFRVL